MLGYLLLVQALLRAALRDRAGLVADDPDGEHRTWAAAKAATGRVS